MPNSAVSSLTQAERERLLALPVTKKAEAARILAQEVRARRPDLLTWSSKHRVEAGAPLDFEAFPFQREIYRAFGDRKLGTVDVMKSSQCGISAAGVSLGLYAGDEWEANVVYVLPGFDDAYDFSDTRVKTAIEASAYLQTRVASTDNKGLKRIGDAFCYFRGSGSERKTLSIPADVLILDEYDRLDQRQVPKFRKRLSAPSSLKLERRFSNPSFPEAGIHGLFLATDQREWLVRCPKCRHEAAIFWDAGQGHIVDENRKARACGRCKRVLSVDTVAQGRWVAQRPEAGRRGYHISKLIVPGQPIPELIEEHHRSDEDSVKAHYNFDLGLPYAPRGGSLSRDLLMACRRDYELPSSYTGREWVSAGVDVGKVLHVRISRYPASERAVAIYVAEVDTFEELAQLWRAYNVNFGLVDERPEERKAREFMEAFRGRCMLIRWSGEDQRDERVIDEDRGLVIPRRTAACDRLVAAITEQKRLLPRTLTEPYLSQMTAPHRVAETTSRGQKVGRYVSERADHYFFAEVHDLLARETRSGEIASGSGPTDTIADKIGRHHW